jgi:hypothetical protein
MTGKSGGPPRPREQIRSPQGPVSACKSPGKFVSSGVEPFSFRFRQNPCLGHCITRGIGLRRQATILRLRGAVLFGGARKRVRRGNSDAPRGVRTHSARISAVLARANVLAGKWNMELCGSAPVIARSAGDFHEPQKRRIYAGEVGPRNSGSGNFGSATWSGQERPRHGLPCWPCAALS